MTTTFRIPTLDEIMNVAQSRGSNSDNPLAWDELVGAWPLQAGGGSTAFDPSGFGNRGTLTDMDPATDWVPSERGGKALEFDASNDYVNIPHQAALSTPYMSVMAWIKGVAFDTNYRTIVSKNYNNAWGFYVRADNDLRALYTKSIGGLRTVDTTTADLVEGEWYHVGMTVSDSECALYVNGEQNLAVSVAGDGGILGNAQPVRIGDHTGASEEHFSGQISDVRIWNRALTPTEILDLYSDPWAAYRLRARVFPAAAVAGGVAPTSHLHGPLVGPLGGPV